MSYDSMYTLKKCFFTTDTACNDQPETTTLLIGDQIKQSIYALTWVIKQ